MINTIVEFNDSLTRGLKMIARTLFSLCIVAAVLPAFGQQAPIMKEGQVTEDALIDALTPAQPLRTRSIRVMRDDEPGGAPAKRASASLLITFATSSASLTERAKRSLDVVGQALASDKLASFRFGIEGYADPRGTSDANLKLSQARAESVRDYLVTSKHIDRARLEPVGKGDQELLNKSNPIAPENRRVTIINLSK
jgi:outer membrane protein OmpA-like peptidoglycan-associated protein